MQPVNMLPSVVNRLPQGTYIAEADLLKKYVHSAEANLLKKVCAFRGSQFAEKSVCILQKPVYPTKCVHLAEVNLLKGVCILRKPIYWKKYIYH